MNKEIIILEPKRELSTGLLYSLNHWRNFLELKLWVSPLINKLNKNKDLTIISIEDLLSNNNINKENQYRFENSNYNIYPDSALKYSMETALKWHLYGNLPDLFIFDDVNIGEYLQHWMMNRLFQLFHKIDNTKLFYFHNQADKVYIHSELFEAERAFIVTTKAMKLKSTFIEPRFYRFFKKQLYLHWKQKEFKYQFLSAPNLYIIENTTSKHNILIDAPYINDFTTILPVIIEMQKLGTFKCYIKSEKEIINNKFPKIKNIRIEAITPSEYHEKFKKLRKYYHSKLKIDKKFQDLFIYNGVAYWDAIKDDMDLLFEKVIFDIIKDMVSFKGILNTINPDIVLVGDDRATRVRSHVLLAKKKGIPILDIQHGIYSPSSPMDTPLSDKLATGGDPYKEVYLKFGANNEQIAVTGWPKYDIYYELKNHSNHKNTGILNILFATQPIGVDLNLQLIETIGLFIENSTKLRLTVKPHPSENINVYSPIKGKYKNVILKDSRANIVNLLDSADLVIIFSSTVGIEAVILDKPLICININNADNKSEFVTNGVALEVKNLNDLIPVIKNALFNKEMIIKMAEARKQFVYDHAYIQDGQASKRVVDLIIQMIEESKRIKIKT